ncbi:MAG: 50S ribosomal protein L13 [Candidatus Marinimicrobia bacterium]|nr:50S ribosomal protein L13 [Candidatus Neomarinimicrobiota bacterium]
MKTYNVKAGDIEREWWIVDATGMTLGRLSSSIAQILRGKHKPTYVPYLDSGDFVIVTNAEKVRVSGNKEEQKTYFRHSGYPGGAKFTSLAQLREAHPERIIEFAVKGMLPHNRLGRAQIKKMKVYAGDSHPHEAQQPKPLEIG